MEYNERDEEDRAGTAPQPMNWAAYQAGPGAGVGEGVKKALELYLIQATFDSQFIGNTA